MTRIKGLLLVFLGAVAFLLIRHWLDRAKEKAQDLEIVRSDLDAGDAHLGLWAQKKANGWVRFRFKRDGSFFYEAQSYPGRDTIRYAGDYRLISTKDQDGQLYPRLLAVDRKGDTVIYHRVYLTRSLTQNVDVLALTCDSCDREEAMNFYRIKQE